MVTQLTPQQAAAKRLLERQLMANGNRYHRTTDEHLAILNERHELEELWRLNPLFGEVPEFAPSERLVRVG